MSYVIQAVLSNAQHPEYGQVTIPPGDLDAERSQTGRLAVSEPAGTWQEDLQAISYSG